MTIKELFEKLRCIPSGLGCMDANCEGCAYEEKERKELEQEIETLIRKETIEEIQQIKVPEKQKSPSYSDSDIVRTNLEWNRLSGMSEMKSKIIEQLSKGIKLD